ncbi:MAG: 3-dehydroquinate synthase, partial [Clostridia bacterium]|nr:3-dehydroquinate synthase [Clostridia bacterium]
MKKITINASTEYDVLIGKDLLGKTGELCAEVIKPCKACIVTDDTVASLYLGVVDASMKKFGFDTVKFIFPHGEYSKNTSVLVELLEFLASNELTRSDCLVALGGGVVGDLCGFAAAVYMRGIKFIQIPTTLLAAVDSSVGGKTAVDLKAGKNLAGAFHQPARVICDYSTLDTLPSETFADGCAEVIKYGAICDRSFFDIFEDGI